MAVNTKQSEGNCNEVQDGAHACGPLVFNFMFTCVLLSSYVRVQTNAGLSAVNGPGGLSITMEPRVSVVTRPPRVKTSNQSRVLRRRDRED